MRPYIVAVAYLLALTAVAVAATPDGCAYIAGVPAYPRIAQAARVQASIEFAVTVGADRRVTSIDLLRGEADVKSRGVQPWWTAFRTVSEDAVKQWQFYPPSRKFQVKFVFTIDQTADPDACPRVLFSFPKMEVIVPPMRINVTDSEP
jgi:hypothetical protein